MGWVIGEFGKYQKRLIKIIIDSKNKRIHQLNVDFHTNGTRKYYEMLFTILPHCDQSKYQFVVRFEPHNDAKKNTIRSVTNRTVKIDNKTFIMKPHYDEMSFDEMCAVWFAEVICKKNYRFDNVIVTTLPPRVDTIKCEGQNEFNFLDITVPEDEKDETILDWWLSRIPVAIPDISITSNSPEVMEIQNNLLLAQCSTLEVTGKTDAFISFIRKLRAKSIIIRGFEKRSETDVEQFVKAMVEDLQQRRWLETKAIYWGQGTVEKGRELIDWLKTDYDDYLKDNGRFVRKNKLCEKDLIFYFKMGNGYTVIGNFENEAQAEKNPNLWANLFPVTPKTT